MSAPTTTLPRPAATKAKTGMGIQPDHRLTDRGTVPVGIIRIRAYRKWEAAGKPESQSLRFWLEAERELLNDK